MSAALTFVVLESFMVSLLGRTDACAFNIHGVCCFRAAYRGTMFSIRLLFSISSACLYRPSTHKQDGMFNPLVDWKSCTGSSTRAAFFASAKVVSCPVISRVFSVERRAGNHSLVYMFVCYSLVRFI